MYPSVFLVATVIAVNLKLTRSMCDIKVHASLQVSAWGPNPPANITVKLSGEWTVYKTNLHNIEDFKEFKCWKQILDANEESYSDIFYRGKQEPLEFKTDMFEGEGFIMKRSLMSDPEFSDYMFLLYSSDDVAAWYICGHRNDSFVVISIRDYPAHIDDTRTQEQLSEAEDIITKVGLEIPPKISTDCPKEITPPLISRPFSIPLDDSGLHTLYWAPDYDAKTISMEIHSKVENGSWIALGISEKEDFSNNDFCMVWTDLQYMNRFQDVWTDESGTIYVDERQDCFYHGYKHEEGVTVAILSRKFDTCDIHDNAIKDGTLNIVWASGPGPIVSLNGHKVTMGERGCVSTRLLRPVHAVPFFPADAWSFTVTISNFPVPKSDISWCKIVQLSDNFSKKHHIIKTESIVTHGNEQLIDKILLRQCAAPQIPTEGTCRRLKVDQTCVTLLAIGPGNISLPKEAGFPIGGFDSPVYAVLEIHYTPKDYVIDRVDSSGLRLHVTSNIRQYDADMLELGLGHPKTVLPPGQDLLPVTSRCVASCTEISLPPEGITLFASRLHAPSAAQGIVTRHMRGKQELPEIVRGSRHDVRTHTMWRLRRDVKVLPGDELITTCWFNTSKDLGTSEMCQNTVYYYPKVLLSICRSSPNDKSLDENFLQAIRHLNHVDQRPRYIKSFDQIKWNAEQELQHLYRDSPVDAECLWGGGRHVPEVYRNWSNIAMDPVPGVSAHCGTESASAAGSARQTVY